MDREVLFRGKRVDNGEWIEGYCVKINNTAFIARKKHTTNGEALIYVEVINETVERYIGLNDKHGKKIFEGDIVSFRYYRDDHIGKVVFNNRTCGFEIWYNMIVGAYGEKATRKINFSQHDKIDIIGNIHDNPELKD